VLAGNYLRLGDGVLQQVVSESALGCESRTESAVETVVRTPPPRWKLGRQRLHRILVLDARLVSAVRMDPPVITGDGASTVAQLIAALNARPRRGGAERAPIVLDPPLRAYLQEQGLRPEDVPARRRRIMLENVTEIEHGAIPVDVTEQMHEDVRRKAVAAAGQRGWANAVVDFRTANIARSPKRCRGRVTRIEPWPDFFLHALPFLARSVEAGDAALGMVFPKGETGRIPAALVVGERGTMSLARSLDRYLQTVRAGVGLALRDRTTIEGRPVDRTLLGRQGGLQFLLRDPRVATVISAVSPRRIVERGLRFDHCNVIAFLDPEPGGNAEAYRSALEVGLAAATDTVVISADNPHVDLVLERIDPARVLLVTTRRRHPVVARHLAAKGAVVLPTPGGAAETLELLWAGRVVATVPVGSLRRTKKEPSGRALRKALFTAALAFGMAPALVENPAGRVAAAAGAAERKDAPAAAEQTPSRVESPGIRHASRPAGSYPSAGGGLDALYRNRR
jgi:cyanophycin synthetase